MGGSPAVAAMLTLSVHKHSGLRMIDVFPANDEVDMVRYRLRLHSAAAVRTIIVESSVTHSGMPKPLHMKQALTQGEMRRYNVRLLEFSFSKELFARANCSSIKCAYVLESGQRQFVNAAIAEELAAIDGEVLVHSSDVDELLDLDSIPPKLPPWLSARFGPFRGTTAANLSGPPAPDGAARWCTSPMLRLYVYSEHCPCTNVKWARSVLCSRQYFEGAMASGGFQLRKLEHGHHCSASAHYMGWHFSYFFDTDKIISKLNAFLHHSDHPIMAVTHSKNPEKVVDLRVRSCIDSRGFRHKSEWSGFDGHLPTVDGWPRHSIWANDSCAAAILGPRHNKSA